MGILRDLTARDMARMPEPGGGAIERVTIHATPDGRVRRKGAAAFLGKSTKTLATWAFQGKGPPFVRIEGHVYYYLTDLAAFVGGTMSTPASLDRGEVGQSARHARVGA